MSLPIQPFSIAKKLVLLISLLLVFVGASGYYLIIKQVSSTIENQSVSVAQIVARQAAAASAVYTKEIIGKVTRDKTGYTDQHYHEKVGALPIPAQFLKSMAIRASKDSEGLYTYRPVSKWNLAEGQWLNNDFLKYAWAELEKQDQTNPTGPINWKPVHKVEKVDGEKTLLYLSPIPAASPACANCHSALEKQASITERRTLQKVAVGREWKQHQLLGAMFVQVPVESMMAVASNESKWTVFWMISVILVGLAALALFFSGSLIKARKVQKELFWQANHDNLTKLPNRIAFEDHTKRLIMNAEMLYATHAMFFLDLDQFKLVNDTCGHAVGDTLLCEITQELQKDLQETDLLARLGGDEFGVLIENRNLKDATLLAEKLCKRVKDYHFEWQEHSFDIGVSIGVVAIDQTTESVDKLMRKADLACYAAKDSGRNCAKVFSEDDEALATRKDEMSWVSGILKALKEDRIIIYSQKIGSVAPDSNHMHHEILVRLIDSEGQIIPPDEFIPAAERYNLMSKLDLAVINRAFSALKNQYFSDLGATGFISINLSGCSLSQPSFLENVKFLMMQYRINPSQVCFEITESSAVANQVLVSKFIVEMKRVGTKFAIDDFGTGLCSLTYLKHFPVNYLKIDGSFIRDIVNNSDDQSIVEMINQMAHKMGMKTIAEYVETKEILTLLDTMNVDYAQGYFLQKPTKVNN